MAKENEIRVFKKVQVKVPENSISFYKMYSPYSILIPNEENINHLIHFYLCCSISTENRQFFQNNAQLYFARIVGRQQNHVSGRYRNNGHSLSAWRNRETGLFTELSENKNFRNRYNTNKAVAVD